MGDEPGPADVLADEIRAGVERPDGEDEEQDPAAFGADRAQRRAGRDRRCDHPETDDECQQRDVQRPEDGRHPGLQPVGRIGLGERRDRGQHHPDGDEQEPAALEDPRDRRVEHDDEGERSAERRERPVAGPLQEPEDLDRREGGDERHGGGEDGAAKGEDDQQDGHEHRGTDRSLTHRPWSVRSAPEAALTAGELEQRGIERVGAEIGPQRIA